MLAGLQAVQRLLACCTTCLCSKFFCPFCMESDLSCPAVEGFDEADSFFFPCSLDLLPSTTSATWILSPSFFKAVFPFVAVSPLVMATTDAVSDWFFFLAISAYVGFLSEVSLAVLL